MSMAFILEEESKDYLNRSVHKRFNFSSYKSKSGEGEMKKDFKQKVEQNWSVQGKP